MTFDESLLNEVSYLSLLAIEGKIYKEQFIRLCELLGSHPAARHYYALLLNIHLGLEDVQVQAQFHEDGQIGAFNPEVLEALAEYERIAPAIPAEVPVPVPEKERAAPKTARPVNKISLVLTLVSMTAMFLLFALLHRLQPQPVGTIGRLERAIGAKWAAVNGQLESGELLCAGPMHLIEGAAEIALDSGATLILEAPAMVELETPSQIFLSRGRLVASIETKGGGRFVVRTPLSSVVDFGTEFGVLADSTGTQTHVFRGQVELRSGSDPLKYHHSVVLNAEQGGQVGTSGEISRVKIIPQTFLRRRQLDLMERAVQGDSYSRWRVFVERLHRDPALVAHYTFEQTPDSEGVLVNAAPRTADTLNGILGLGGNRPQWVQGRWPQKQALRFEREMNQRVVVPAQKALAINGPLTVAAWIYLEPGDSSGHLFTCRDEVNVNYQFGWLGDSHPDKPNRNRIQLLRYTETRTQRGYSPIITLSPGMWHCLAATHDNQTVRFYLDGVFLAEVSDPFSADAAAADLIIGDMPFEAVKEWHFDGTVDEIVILNRVMTSAELVSLYQAGKP